MPLPTPQSGESRDDFLNRCIPIAEKESDSNEQAVAICMTQYRTNAMNQIRVNLKTKVNNAKIRREIRNGKEHIIVPSATLPDNVVMNGGLYPAEEIEKSYKSLERTPAPLGHPLVNGQYVSARDVDAINNFWVGAYNENVIRKNGRVFLDKVIDVEVANSSDKGRELLDAINEGKPIHTSTGLLVNQEPVEGEDYKWIARNMDFDHDAILINEAGAAGPEQGVGMMVNSKGEEIKVVNMDMPEDDYLMIAAEMIENGMYQKERSKNRASIYERLKNMLSFSTETNSFKVNNQEDDDMSEIKRDEFDALAEKVEALNATAEGLKDAVAEQLTEALAPVTEQIEQINTKFEDSEKAEREQLTDKVVNAGLLDADDAKELNINALRKLADKTTPGQAAPLFPAMNAQDENKMSNELPED